MIRNPVVRRWVYALVVVAGFAPAAPAQLSFTFTYQDPAGTGFNAGGGVGQLRKDTMTGVGNYLATVFDARGGVTIDWAVSNSTIPAASSTAAFAGTSYLSLYSTGGPNIQATGLQNGEVFQAARQNTSVFGPPHGDGEFNFAGTNFFATGLPSPPGSVPPNSGATQVGASQIDLWSVALHEITHIMGFNSGIKVNGSGRLNNTPGTNDQYGFYDKFIVRGTGNGLINTPNNNTASYAGTAGNPAPDLISNDLFWVGEFGVAANGGQRIKLFAPGAFDSGSSISHVDPSGLANGVMTPASTAGTATRTYTGAEIGMMIDIGWNQFVWNGSSGNWGDGTTSLFASRWTNASFPVHAAFFNGNRVLPPVGTITANLVLTFGGSVAFTSNNTLASSDLSNPFLLNRLFLTNTAATASTITGNPLRFSNDNGFNVAPAVHQNGTGAFVLDTRLDIPKGLTFAGTGTGQVSVQREISGAGAITHQGNYALVFTAANTYTLGTTVGGAVGTSTLRVTNTAGSGTGTGAVAIGANGVLAGGLNQATSNTAGRVGGNVTVAGAVRPGDLAAGQAGQLHFTGTTQSVAFNAGGKYSWSLVALTDTAGQAGIGFDQLVVTDGDGLSLASGTVRLLFTAGTTPSTSTAFWQSAHSWTILSIPSAANGVNASQFASIENASDFASVGSFTLNTGLNGSIVLNFALAPVPEPGHILLIAGGVLGLYSWRRRLAPAGGEGGRTG